MDADYQLTVEDAADVARHEAVVFVDAAVEGREPFAFRRVAPSRTESFSTHSVSPGMVVGLAAQLFGATTKAYILAVRGYSFEMFTEAMTAGARENMDRAVEFLLDVLETRDFEMHLADENQARNGGPEMKDGKYVILCIDDDQDVLTSLRMVLEANAYEMAEAGTAEEGLKVYKAEQPDFVIVDLMMESVDAGKNFVKELQLLNNAAPVYMLSSVGDSLASNVQFSDLGLTGVFQKPVDTNTLLTTLKTKLR